MGGNLLTTWGLPEKRIGFTKFTALQELVCRKLECYSFSVYPIKSYEYKQSFGDLDLLVGVHKRGTRDDVLTQVSHLTHHRPHINGDVISFPYDGFQVDLICVDNSAAGMALAYFNYNDVSNLMGRMATQLGLSYGHTGLQLKVNSSLFGLPNNGPSSRVMLTDRPSEIQQFFGLDTRRYHEGFQELEDIYEWVVTCKYFNKDAFLLDNLAHDHRVRNRKRPTYMGFLDWCEQTNPPDKFTPNKTQNYYINDILAAFPDARTPLERVGYEWYQNRMIQKKFNGVNVALWTGLEGPTLGKLMAQCRQLPQFAKQQLLLAPTERIQKQVLDVFNAHQAS